MSETKPPSALARSLSHQAPTGDGVARIERLRAAAIAFAEVLESETKASRETSLAKTHLEESVMWAVKGIVLEAPR